MANVPHSSLTIDPTRTLPADLVGHGSRFDPARRLSTLLSGLSWDTSFIADADATIDLSTAVSSYRIPSSVTATRTLTVQGPAGHFQDRFLIITNNSDFQWDLTNGTDNPLDLASDPFPLPSNTTAVFAYFPTNDQLALVLGARAFPSQLIQDAEEVTYDNNDSGLSATNVKAALDELDSDIDGIAAGAIDPSIITSDASPFALTESMGTHEQVTITSHQASVDFEVPQSANPGISWLIRPSHDSCTLSVNGDTGSVNAAAGSSARLINSEFHFVYVRSNPGTAPVVVVTGVPALPTSVSSTRAYDTDDHGFDFDLVSGAGDQTFPIAANLTDGFFVNLFNTSGGDITIVGTDANHTLSNPGALTVKKLGTALIATGTGGTTVLDAA